MTEKELLLKETLKNILKVLPFLPGPIKHSLVTNIYVLNKTLGGKNQDLNLFFCRHCLDLAKNEKIFPAKDLTFKTKCCNKMVNITYKYNDLTDLVDIK